MSRFFSQSFLIPTWFITIGVVALSTPPPTIGMAAFLFLGGVVIVPAVIFALGLRLRPVVASPPRARDAPLLEATRMKLEEQNGCDAQETARTTNTLLL